MTDALRDRLAELRRAIAAADDDAARAALEAEAAAVHVGLGQPEEAKKRLGRARDLRDAAGDPARAAEARYGIGLLEARNPARLRQAATAFTEALAGFAAAPAWAGRTHQQLAAVHLLRDDAAAAEAALVAAADAFAAAGQAAARIDALRERAQVLALAGRDREAMAALGDALAAAREAGLDGAAAALRLDRRALAGPQGEAEDPVPAILAEAMSADRADVRGRVLLTRASERAQAGDLEPARRDGEAARRAALEAVDPVTYAMACLLLAEVHERSGDRLAAVTVLVVCQGSLGKLLGDEARVPILRVLEGLAERWGDAEFDAVLDAYRASVG